MAPANSALACIFALSSLWVPATGNAQVADNPALPAKVYLPVVTTGDQATHLAHDNSVIKVRSLERVDGINVFSSFSGKS